MGSAGFVSGKFDIGEVVFPKKWLKKYVFFQQHNISRKYVRGQALHGT
jgi:hypothetical protein